MRSATVTPHLRCNQACAFCTDRRSSEPLGPIQPAAVRARIESALADGASEIVLSGGEPTLRADLPSLVAHARARGARRVLIETNATLLDAGRAQALRQAGLDLARVHLSGWGSALDRVTRDEGGFEAALRGVDALLQAGCPVEISAVITRSTAPLLPPLPPRLVERFGRALHGLRLGVPHRSPDPSELLPLDQATAVLIEVERAARSAGLLVALQPGAAPPPCLFPPGERPPYLYALSPGGAREPGFRKVEACAGCQVDDRCPGFPAASLDRDGTPPALWPIKDDRSRRRLSLVGDVREQIQRELVSQTLQRVEGGGIEDTIRIQFQCNQRCHFCFVSTHLPAPPDEQVRAAIASAASRGAKVVLSGGEPTLNPRLADYLRLARELTGRSVQLQTNAVRLDDAGLCRTLVEAGLDQAFVSLHGSDAATSDAITGAPGTFARTLRGLDHLHEAGVEVQVNFVICASNLEHLAPTVRLVAARWPRASFCVSFVAPSSDLVPADASTLPRYSSAMPALAEALAEAERLGVQVVGFDSMCGLPLCLLPPGVAGRVAPNEIPDGFDAGEFVKTEACARCSLGRRCFGLRRRYADLYGADELRPLAD